jgi:hypothetical protein
VKAAYWMGTDAALARAVGAKPDTVLFVGWRGLDMLVAGGPRIVGLTVDPRDGGVQPLVEDVDDDLDLEEIVHALESLALRELMAENSE